MCGPRSSAEARLAAGVAVAALLAVAGCREDRAIVLELADGLVLAPTADTAAYLPGVVRFGMPTLIVPWTRADTDVPGIVSAARAGGVAPIVGLVPARRAQDEWNAPDAPPPDLAEALARLAPSASALAGVHLELGSEPPSPAFLDATVAQVRAALPGAPLSFGLDARGTGLARLQDAGFPPPGTLDPTALDHADDREAWARAWAAALTGRAARAVVHSRGLARGQTERERADLVRLGVLLGEGVEVWATVDPIVPWARTASASLARAPRLRTQDELRADVGRLRDVVDRVLIRGVEAYAPDQILGARPAPRPPRTTGHDAALEARARDADARLWRCCWRDGQIVAVYDARTLPELGPNQWQEDACWITGLYAAAASFRAAVTGAAGDQDRARAAYRGIRAMARTTPLPGEVVRNGQRALYAQTAPAEGETKKRWRRSPDRELYWVGDVSVDQLSGWFLGMTVFHDLVATDEERAEIRAIVAGVLDTFLAHDLHAVAYGDDRTTFGDLRAQPVLALAFFQIGAHLTGDPRYRAEVERLMDAESMHWQIANVLALYHAAGRFGSDHFYASGLLPLVGYETDPLRRAKLAVALDVVHAIKRPHGDAYADMVYAVLHRTHDAGRRAARELSDYQPAYLENARFLATSPAAPAGPFHPIAARPAAELDFDYVPPGAARVRGGLEGRFTGVGFMLAYWMGRFYEVL